MSVFFLYFHAYLCQVMKDRFDIQKIVRYGFMLVAFVMPLHKKMMVPALLVLTFVLLFQIRFSRVFETIKNNKPLFFLPAYYLLYALALIWSLDQKGGMFDLEVKLSFALLPLIFIFISEPLSEKDFKQILSAFVFGTLVGMLICLIQATMAFIKEPIVYYTFVSSRLSILHHPTYYSMFVNLSLVIVLIRQRRHTMRHIPAFVIAFACIGFNWLLMSRSGLVTTGLIIFIYWLSLFFEKKAKGALMILLVFLIVGIATVSVSKYTLQRISSMGRFFSELTHGATQPDKKNLSDPRIVTWEAAWHAISNKPILGAGTGGEHIVLNDFYREKNYCVALDRSLNTHNQFLQNWVATGIIGVLLLLLIFVFGYIRCRKQQFLSGCAFLSIVLITLLTESGLETQSGVVFFSFFYCLIIVYRKDIQPNTSQAC